MKLNQNLLLVDDHMVVRKGVSLIIKDKFVNITTYNAENYTDALDLVAVVQFYLILLDININGVENIKIMKEIKNIQPNVKILIFSSHEESQYGLRYIKQGADGFLNKFCSEDKIVEAINKMLNEGFYYSQLLKEKLSDKKNKKSSNNPIDLLSNREHEISKLLISGLGNLEISNKLEIQMSTVSTYKNRIFEKLNVNNIVSLSELFKANS